MGASHRRRICDFARAAALVRGPADPRALRSPFQDTALSMCVINHTHQFVFVHIPKNAGTSTTFTLAPLTTYADLELGSTEYGEALHDIMGPRFGLAKHSFAHEIRGVVGQQTWSRYFSFSFVRNPFDRTWSIYTYLKKHPGNYPFIKRYKSLDEFVLSDDWDQPGPDRMIQPQLYWLRQGPRVQKPIVDFIGKVETYHEDLERVLELVGLNQAKRKTLRIEKKNESRSSKAKTPTLSAPAIDRVLKRYADDFKTFGYAAEPPAGWVA